MIFIALFLVLVSFVLYVKWRQTHWQRRGVASLKPDFLTGNITRQIRGKISLGEHSREWYDKLKILSKTHGGIYQFLDPIYIPLDPVLIKQILTRDFQHFMNHGTYHHPNDILSMHVFNVEGQNWRYLRTKLTPTFTSGKIKIMFETLREKTEGLEKMVAKYAKSGEAFAIKDVVARFTTDIIASCAFGIDCNSMEDPDNNFRKYGSKVFEPRKLKQILTTIVPWVLLAKLGFKMNGKDVTNFFTNIVKNTIRSRESNEIYRKDFMHLLIQLKNLGKTDDSSSLHKGKEREADGLSEEEIIAQCFVFFAAGFETSSTTVTFALLCLCQNPDIQEKLRQEIKNVMQKNGGTMSYDALKDMPYLDKVIKETLRRYPPVSVLSRMCSKRYTVPNTDVIIEKGTRVFVPVWSLHMDPEYYPNPEIFDPERFSEENNALRPDFTFLPFGEGPRMCIGLRFGMLKAKVGLVSLLSNFKFTLNKKTATPVQMSPGTLVMTVDGDVWLNATKI